MPNWITNRLVVKGNPQRIRNFLHLIKSERQPLDFHSIIPAPEIIRHAIKGLSPIGPAWQEQYFIDETHRPRDFTPEEKKELDALGHRSWGDWSFANWGTNKNAFDVEIDESTVGLGYVVIDFETAWSPPVRILERLRDMFPDIAFSCEWVTEDESFYEVHPSQPTAIARSERDRVDEHTIATLYLTQAEYPEFCLEIQTTKKTGSGYQNPTSSIEPMTQRGLACGCWRQRSHCSRCYVQSCPNRRRRRSVWLRCHDQPRKGQLPKNPIPISTRMTISPLAVALPHAERVFAECLHPVTWR